MVRAAYVAGSLEPLDKIAKLLWPGGVGFLSFGGRPRGFFVGGPSFISPCPIRLEASAKENNSVRIYKITPNLIFL